MRHASVDKYLQVSYARTSRSYGYKRANISLRGLDESLVFAGGITSTMDDEAICNLASTRAIQCKGIYKECAVKFDISTIYERLNDFCEGCGVSFPVSLRKKDKVEDFTRKTLGAAERVSDERWWRRQLRTRCGRQTEGVLRSVGFVRSGKSAYVSNWAFARWKSAQVRNRKTLSRLEAVTKDACGDELAVDLTDCVDGSVSNPENRRNELMTRARGYQEVAERMGLVCGFFTLTCPSRFHAQLSRGGRNSKYDGSTPIDAMNYLNKTWSLIRAEWGRRGLKVFGFRVAEPNHDGTPHFHFSLFLNEADTDAAWQVFREKALLVDGDEVGAVDSRAVFKVIPAGQATAYIAKYISKNIDGFNVGEDWEAECLASEGALRVRAWASLWGIRQFQQIGSVSVTVWRELRRKREIFDDVTPEEVEALRSAADRGDWREFVELMGGPHVARDEQALRPAYVESEVMASAYGDAVKRLIGVWLKPVARAIGRCMIPTRDKVWFIREREARIKAAQPPPLDLCQ